MAVSGVALLARFVAVRRGGTSGWRLTVHWAPMMRRHAPDNFVRGCTDLRAEVIRVARHQHRLFLLMLMALLLRAARSLEIS